MQWILKKIIGSKNERDLKQLRAIAEKVNEREEALQELSDEELKAFTPKFREQLSNGASLDDVLVDACAVVKNACRRLVGTTFTVAEQEREWVEIPYDVQIMGGIAMHRGMIAEMATGEGKTLVAIIPTYLNALTGRGVHIVTVNDYLARRDAEWMGLLYGFLGLSVGCIQNSMRPEERREEYKKDITYGTNSEFGFDYLRDNMAMSPENMVQRGHYYAIIDEIDSILIDEAKTPLIISGPSPHSTEGEYRRVKPLVEALYKKQRSLIDKKVLEAERLVNDGNVEEASYLLYQIGQGMPRHKKFLKLIEEPAIRRIYEKVRDAMVTDTNKEQARELREDLFFVVDEKSHDASLTDKGCELMSPDDPEAYVLPDIVTEMADLEGQEGVSDEQKHEKRQQLQEEFSRKSETIHAVDQLIRAYTMYERDVQYVVQENQVHIVDENTGRLMAGRRWSDGLHQAVEAKEGVKIERETQTLATITIQNYFRMYEKLAGMTGTAETEADEFHEIYGLDVLVVPTNRPVRRVDYNDPIYKTRREKFSAVVDEIADCHERKQPVLVGTITVEASELLSRMLRRRKIPHNVLNAKNHQTEAEIVARAGQPGAVTIATNMAGRGTDIKLGDGVVTVPRDVLNGQIALEDKYEGTTLEKFLTEHPCGLHVIGTERHESRRIDRQLRGRCSRQGDPGSSRFYVSLEDDLMRLFGSDRISGVMEKLGIEEGEVLEHPWLNKSIERAQRKVEEHHFSIRKRTLEYDDVMNKQREIVYGLRSDILQSDTPRTLLMDIIDEVVEEQVETLLSENEGEGEPGVEALIAWAKTTFPIGLKKDELSPIAGNPDKITDLIVDKVRRAYDTKVQMEDPERFVELERYLLLQAIDHHWQEYLRAIDGLRQSVGLRAYGQKDPLVEFKHEAYGMFSDLMGKIHMDMARRSFHATTSMEAMQNFLHSMKIKLVHEDISAMDQQRQAAGLAPATQGGQGADGGAVDQALKRVEEKKKAEPMRRDVPKVGRNEPCPCGSGKKYKQCHGKMG